MEVLKFECEQGRKELIEERERNTRLAKELVVLKLTQGIDIECRYRAKENQHRAEKERKDME